MSYKHFFKNNIFRFLWRVGIFILIISTAFFYFDSCAYSAARKKNNQNDNQKNQSKISQDINANSDTDLTKEIEIGKKALAQIEKEWPIIIDPAIVSRLEMILNKLEPHMKRRIPWELRLVKTDAINAFCLPGGFIFFTTGIIDMLKTDSEIAAVMAHEMIHADRKHSLRMAAKSNKVTVAALAAMVLSGGAVMPVVLAQVAQVAITSGYTIEFETEADSLGLDALIASGYSPVAMITLFEKFMNEDFKQPIREYGIYMNHPETPERLKRALQKLNSLGIPVERKYSLGLLRTSITESSGKTELKVDGVTVASGNKNSEVRAALTRIRENLDKYLQLELAPYELHLVNGALYIKNHFTAGTLQGITTPDSIRKNLLKILDSARAKHPTAKFFQ